MSANFGTDEILDRMERAVDKVRDRIHRAPWHLSRPGFLMP